MHGKLYVVHCSTYVVHVYIVLLPIVYGFFSGNMDNLNLAGGTFNLIFTQESTFRSI